MKPSLSREEELEGHIEFIKQELEYHRARSEYFEKLLLVKTGVIVVSDDMDIKPTSPEEFTTIHRIRTLSGLRRAAEEMSRKKDIESRPKTQAEEIFEKSLRTN